MARKTNNHNIIHYLLTILSLIAEKSIVIIISLLLIFFGYFIFVKNKQTFQLVAAIPLILAGAGILINSLWSIVLVVFSPAYNRGVCTFCNKN